MVPFTPCPTINQPSHGHAEGETPQPSCRCHCRLCYICRKLQPHHIHGIIDAFKKSPDLRREGFHFGDKIYQCVRADKNSIYAKCDNDGVIMVKTKSNILLATYRDGMYPSVCVEATEKLGCYFHEKEI
ncbi:profilin-4 isoform X2 [Dendrobates tinctorius]|uniref:profilin-4 isoform X2 n=1 Tax=Dendrobates tinctorius TaxID=92724 RepID=UPI003CC9F125